MLAAAIEKMANLKTETKKRMSIYLNKPIIQKPKIALKNLNGMKIESP